ncbi:MAG: hypothetical protein LBM28_05625 [Oscillospiraceae bacterium]|jgi:hypothetical protein|nr:hypothetical protein [Oscillospiraceae bacterium]
MLFRKNIVRACAYCTRAAKVDEESCLCAKRGIVVADFHCRKFKYDPLKRVPPRPKAKDFAEFDDIDFTL